MGAVSLRSLDVAARLWLRLGRRRAVGIRAVPLWTLGLRWRPLGLVSRRIRRPAALGAGARGVVRRRGFRPQPWPQQRGCLWLGPARVARAVRAVVARMRVA